MLQILIIDDDPIVHSILTNILKKEGYQIITTFYGEEGIALAQNFRPALIICDWILPVMNGVEVCRCIKADPNLSTTFFIVLTSLDSVTDRVKALDAGADDFISKPIEPNELKARVRAGLRLHQLSHDLQTQKQILETELAEATEYVRSLLPPPMNEPLKIDYRFIPSQRLGGDCFDYYWLDPDYLAIYLLDTAGHGLSATLPSISVLNLLRSRTIPQLNYYQPSEVLSALNETFQLTYQNNKYFTIWYGVYNRINRQLIYSTAGHPPGILLSGKPQNTQIQLLQTSGVPVGMFPDAKYVNSFSKIEEFSTLYIFSDGAYEIRLSNGKMWDYEGFIELLQNNYDTNNGNLDKIVNYILTSNSKDILNDDLSILEVKF